MFYLEQYKLSNYVNIVLNNRAETTRKFSDVNKTYVSHFSRKNIRSCPGFFPCGISHVWNVPQD